MIIDALNEDREFELGAIMQYMGHHYEAEGMESPAIIELFKKTAIDEMKHAEMLAVLAALEKRQIRRRWLLPKWVLDAPLP